jgi:hypothetical protein
MCSASGRYTDYTWQLYFGFQLTVLSKRGNIAVGVTRHRAYVMCAEMLLCRCSPRLDAVVSKPETDVRHPQSAVRWSHALNRGGKEAQPHADRGCASLLLSEG